MKSGALVKSPCGCRLDWRGQPYLQCRLHKAEALQRRMLEIEEKIRVNKERVH